MIKPGTICKTTVYEWTVLVIGLAGDGEPVTYNCYVLDSNGMQAGFEWIYEFESDLIPIGEILH